MCKLHPEDEDARRQVEQFCKRVDYLRVVHDIGMELFHDKHAQSLMERTAHVFFFDLSRMVIDHFLLEVAKLIDPATSPRRGGEVENFTVDNMLESIRWPVEVLKELEGLRGSALSFRAYIKPARNKILAHNDKRTFLSGATLGSFPKGEDEKVMDALKEMCNVLHEASFGSVYGAMAQAHPGDVRDLKQALMQALAFDRCERNASKEVRDMMNKCLLDIKMGDI